MQLAETEASYNLSLDCQNPIMMLILQADIPIDILSDHKCVNMKDKPRGCYLLSTFKFDNEDQRRITLKLRTSEGRNGILSILVLPYTEKTAVSLELPIKALNLHTRCSISDAQLDKRPVSSF